jgi:hypothetical protein
MAQAVAELKRQSSIPQAAAPKDRLVVFSFKYLDRTNGKYGLACCKDKGEWVEVLLEKLKHACGLTLNDFIGPQNNPKSWRAHPLEFEKTSEKQGFPFSVAIWQDNPRQFQLEKTKGRVHGFMIENIFHVVWLDPVHALFP